MAETERDGLRNELNDALTALDENRHKLNTVNQVLICSLTVIHWHFYQAEKFRLMRRQWSLVGYFQQNILFF